MAVETFRKHGVTKVALVVICVIVAGALTFLVLLPFVALLEESCKGAMPFLGCENLSDGTGWVMGALSLVLWPFIGVPWLLKRSYLSLSLVIVSMILVMIAGGLSLKRIYESKQVI